MADLIWQNPVPHMVVEQLQDETDVPVIHRLWKVNASENEFFEQEFKKVPRTYVADGHHRSAAAYNVGKMRKERAQQKGLRITGDEDFNYFMSIIYPSDNLNQIMDYNRVIKTFNGRFTSSADFISALNLNFADVREYADQSKVRPARSGITSLLIDGKWHECVIRDEAVQAVINEHNGQREVASLDVQVLNDRVLRDLLGVENVRASNVVDFVGGSRGLEGLVKRCNIDSVAAFAMHPVTIDKLLDVADAGLNMPPKSTWFEPKPRSGYVVRVFDQ